ncbi:MAG TPA: hypothetical protein VF915_23850, partial [Reyranella sp.]
EQPAEAAASEPRTPRTLAPSSALRKQLAEMAAQVQAMTNTIEQERAARVALEQKLAGKPAVSAQVAASPTAGAAALETVEIQPGQVANAAEAVAVEQTELPAAAAAAEASTEEPAEEQEVAQADAPKLETFEALMESLSDGHRALIEKHISGLRTALETERGDRKAAQKAIRSVQTELEQLKAGNVQVKELELRAAEAEAAATFFEEAAAYNVKRGSMRLAFLAAQDGHFFGDDGGVQWDALQARFPDLFEGSNDRPAPDGALRETTGKTPTVGSERPAPAPRTSASAGAGAGAAPPRRPFSMSSAIRSAAGRRV